MSVFDVRIEYMDGQVDLIPKVSRVDARGGQLELWYDGRNDMGALHRHLGGFPLANIRKWRKVEP